MRPTCNCAATAASTSSSGASTRRENVGGAGRLRSATRRLSRSGLAGLERFGSVGSVLLATGAAVCVSTATIVPTRVGPPSAAKSVGTVHSIRRSKLASNRSNRSASVRAGSSAAGKWSCGSASIPTTRTPASRAAVSRIVRGDSPAAHAQVRFLANSWRSEGGSCASCCSRSFSARWLTCTLPAGTIRIDDRSTATEPAAAAATRSSTAASGSSVQCSEILLLGSRRRSTLIGMPAKSAIRCVAVNSGKPVQVAVMVTGAGVVAAKIAPCGTAKKATVAHAPVQRSTASERDGISHEQ